MTRLMQVVTAAVVLAVAVLAVGAFAPAGGAPQAVTIAPGDDAVLAAQSSKKVSKPAPKAVKAGESAPEVLAEEWIATGGGGGGGGSPKG